MGGDERGESNFNSFSTSSSFSSPPPPKKKKLTLMFFLLVKNRSVALGPIVSATPLRKSRLPIASSPRSKKKATPRKVKRTPKAVRPTPISVFFLDFVVVMRLSARGRTEGKANGGERERGGARVSFCDGRGCEKEKRARLGRRRATSTGRKKKELRSFQQNALRLSSSILFDCHERGSRGTRPVPWRGKRKGSWMSEGAT